MYSVSIPLGYGSVGFQYQNGDYEIKSYGTMYSDKFISDAPTHTSLPFIPFAGTNRGIQELLSTTFDGVTAIGTAQNWIEQYTGGEWTAFDWKKYFNLTDNA
jgi:hypothetical protein